jgi:hypothetical protein
MAVVSSDLAARFATAEIDRLGRRLGGVLRDNPEGAAVFATGLERAVEIGFEAQCAVAGSPSDGSASEKLWSRWHAQRQLAPEAASWPERLAHDDGVGAAAIAAAEEALLEVGAELGLTTRGRSTRIALREIGAQAAEAGAALRCALDDHPPEPPPPVAIATPDLHVPPRGETVRVAAAASFAECEMLQGLLANHGIPSAPTRTTGDHRYPSGFGDYDIYVPLSAAEQARVVLSTPVPAPDRSDDVDDG